jgi:hypothetical protein
MFAAYFDDSGTDGSSAIAVASCYIGRVEQWDRLTKAWDCIRSRAGREFEYFASADCLSGGGQFSGWSRAEREWLIDRLMAEILVRVRIGISAAVIKADYDSILGSGWKRRVAGSTHFAFAVKDCLRQIKRWREQFQITEKIKYVFDLTGKGKGEIDATLSDLLAFDAESFGLYKDGYSFENKRAFPPLQAVDILAHQSYQHMRDCIVGRSQKCLDYMPTLSNVPLRTQYFDAENLRELFAKYPWDEIRAKYPKICADDETVYSH